MVTALILPTTRTVEDVQLKMWTVCDRPVWSITISRLPSWFSYHIVSIHRSYAVR